jgi:hypothetical protein
MVYVLIAQCKCLCASRLKQRIDRSSSTLIHLRETTNSSQKITVAKVLETYVTREPGADIDLWFKGAVVPLGTQMRDLGTFDDPYIAFRAVEKRVRPVSHFSLTEVDTLTKDLLGCSCFALTFFEYNASATFASCHSSPNFTTGFKGHQVASTAHAYSC